MRCLQAPFSPQNFRFPTSHQRCATQQHLRSHPTLSHPLSIFRKTLSPLQRIELLLYRISWRTSEHCNRSIEWNSRSFSRRARNRLGNRPRYIRRSHGSKKGRYDDDDSDADTVGPILILRNQFRHAPRHLKQHQRLSAMHRKKDCIFSQVGNGVSAVDSHNQCGEQGGSGQ